MEDVLQDQEDLAEAEAADVEKVGEAAAEMIKVRVPGSFAPAVAGMG